MERKSRGKDFESVIQESFERVPDTLVYRVPDQMTYRYGSKNPCDFFIYHKPVLYCFECKATNKQSLPFANISENQWTELLKMSAISGVIAGILCWYVNYDKTVFIPIQFLETLKQNGAKSIRYDADDLAIIELRGRKKRVFWEYDAQSFFQSIPL